MLDFIIYGPQSWKIASRQNKSFSGNTEWQESYTFTQTMEYQIVTTPKWPLPPEKSTLCGPLVSKISLPFSKKVEQAHKLEIKTPKFCQQIAKPIVYCKFSVVTCRTTMMNWVTAVTPPKPVHQRLVFQFFSSPTSPRPNFEDEGGECCYRFCLHLWDHGVTYGYITVNATIAWCSIQSYIFLWLCSGLGNGR